MNDAIDMRDTIIPKSNQLNADDLIGGAITVTISAVARASTAEQPIAVSYQGENGKPYFPCKMMRRVMVSAWGIDASEYVGRSMTLFRDPKVLWGGVQVGGIRISHLSHIDGPLVLALAESKTVRRPFRVLPLVLDTPTPPKADRALALRNDLVARVDAAADGPALYALVDDETAQKQRAWLKSNRPELSIDVEAAFMGARQRTEVVA